MSMIEETQRPDAALHRGESSSAATLESRETSGQEKVTNEGLAPSRSRVSQWSEQLTAPFGLTRSRSRHNPIVLSFDDDEPENPYNWPFSKKCYVLIVGIVAVLNSTLGSSLPSNAISYIAKDFHVTNEQQLVLPISLFLVGYVLGPVFFGPLSETYGRKIVMVCSFLVLTLFTMACALAPNWPSLLVFRLICGVSASSPISVVGGLYADIFNDPVTRGRAMAIFMFATTCGPMLAPTISGFVSPISWRWTFWVGLIVAGVSLSFLLFLPETYAPTLLQRRAHKLRQAEPDVNYVSPIDLEKKGAKQMITVVLMRPLNMLIFESIVLFTCLYLALAYAIFYLSFEAYPIIYQGVYHFSTGVSGLAFMPALLGCAIALAIFLYYDTILRKAQRAHKPWSEIEEYRRLPLACLGGPFFVISLFWLGWTARPDVHWIVPMIGGVPFGIGLMIIFIALLNYLTDAYEVYAASAMAAGSFSRSIFGALLPLAAKPMYDTLGINWASSLLGFISLAMTVIPFIFLKYGDKIRANSQFCRQLKADKERLRLEKEQRKRTSAEAEVSMGAQPEKSQVNDG